MIIQLLSAHARVAVLQPGWQLHIRLTVEERELDPSRPPASRIVTELAQVKNLSITRRFDGKEHETKFGRVGLEGKDVPLGFCLSTDGWPEGSHWLRIDATHGKHPLSTEIPILVLGKDAYWAKFTRNWESKYNHPELSGNIQEIYDALADVLNSFHAKALPSLGARVDWSFGDSLGSPKNHVLETPVNMWTLYQLMRLIERQGYEQLFWGGAATVHLSEDEQLLVVRADFKSECEIANHFIEMLRRSAPHLPDLKTIAIRVDPPYKISLIAKFPLHHAAGGGIQGGPEVKVTGPGGMSLTPVLAEFNLCSLKQPA